MIFALGLVLAFVLMLVFAPRGAARRCRWRADRSRDAEGRRYWRCSYCGAETLAEGDTPPTACHAPR